MEANITLQASMKSISTVSGKPNVINVSKVEIKVLELEDTLFHTDSAVMMPSHSVTNENADSQISNKTEENQQFISGIKSIALVLKQFEINAEQKLIIAGHNDIKNNSRQCFELSELQAKNVLYLLTGEDNGSAWARSCEQQHSIEDYKQILHYFAVRKSWNCDPGKTDTKWGQKTEDACREFFTKAVPTKAEKIVSEIVNNSDKKWPIHAWKAVYTLYEEELCEALKITSQDLVARRKRIKFVKSGKQIVSCGASFPVDLKERNNYRSRSNRRVEILFFKSEDIPSLVCPEDTSTEHQKHQCPIWNDFFRKCFINPEDLYAEMFYLKFVYFDKIRKKLLPVSEKLDIKAIQNCTDDPKNAEALTTTVEVKDGVQHIKVLFKTIKDPAIKSFHFEFTTDNLYVYTETADESKPVVLVKKTPAEFDALTFQEQYHFYDLPSKWSSINYRTLYDGKDEGTDSFQDVVKTIKTLRPFGDTFLTKDKPLVFSLDDVVLLDSAGGTQDIKDENHERPPMPVRLSNMSRVKIFISDPKDVKIVLYKRDTAAHTSSRIPFLRNYITENIKTCTGVVCIYFRNGFYSVGRIRTSEENLWQSKNYVVGARVAILDAPGVHLKQACTFNSSNKDTEFGYTGDYELHYFHNMRLDVKHPVSYMFVYTSVAFMRDSRFPDKPKASRPPDQADVEKFMDEGVYFAMEYWNKKNYFFAEDPDTDESIRIKLYYFIDEKETFKVDDDKRPTNKDFDKNPRGLMTHNAVNAARKNAYGGKSKYLALIVNEDDAWQWTRRNDIDGGMSLPYSLLKLNKDDYQGGASPWKIKSVAEDGFTYKYFTFAHELGHCFGLPDEYVKRRPLYPGGDSFPNLDQFFEPYTMFQNEGSMMHHNFAPRLHTTWYYLHKLNSSIVASSGMFSFEKSINTLLTNKLFKARYVNGTDNYTYDWKMVGDNAVHKNMRKPCYIEQNYPIPGAAGKNVYLALHHVSQDESSEKNFHSSQKVPYRWVLMVRLVFNYSFPATAYWTDVMKEFLLAQIMKKFTSLQKKYHLINCSDINDRIYINFLIAFESSGILNYTVSFTDDITISRVHVANAPLALSAISPLKGVFSYEMYSNEIKYTGKMPYEHVALIQNLFVQAADKNAVVKLRDKTRSLDRIQNAGGTLIINRDITMEEVVNYCLNIGADEMTSFNYLKTWIDGKTGGNYTFEKIV